MQVVFPVQGVLAEAAAVLAPNARDMCAELIKLNIYGPGELAQQWLRHWVASLPRCLPRSTATARPPPQLPIAAQICPTLHTLPGPQPCPGAFFKAHRDTPMGGKHVGSLVVCLPCGPHKGGQLVLRHQVGLGECNGGWVGGWGSLTCA